MKYMIKCAYGIHMFSHCIYFEVPVFKLLPLFNNCDK